MSIYDLYKIPYNNARCIYDALELESPSQLGGDCVYIAQQTKDALERAGFKSTIISQNKPGPRVHFANLIEGSEGDRYFFDPRFGMITPLQIPDICGKQVTSSTMPTTLSLGCKTSKSTMVKIKLKSQNCFSVDLFSRLTSNNVTMHYDLNEIKPIPSAHQLAGFFMRSLHITVFSPWDNGLYKLNYDMHSTRYYLFRTKGRSINPSGKTYPDNPGFEILKEYFQSGINMEFIDVLNYLEQATALLTSFKESNFVETT